MSGSFDCPCRRKLELSVAVRIEDSRAASPSQRNVCETPVLGSGEGGLRDSQHRYKSEHARPGDETQGSAASVDKVRHVQQHPPMIPCRSTHGHSTHGSDRRIAGYGYHVLKSSAVLDVLLRVASP